MARKRAGLTQIQLAEASGVKQGTISKIERGDQNESAFDSILGHHLNINSYWLSTGKGEPVGGSQPQPVAISQANPYFTPPDAIPVKKIPLISWVKAGGWCESPDNHAPCDAEEWLDCPFPFSQHAFCLAVTRDSMWPEYREGEYILVDPGIDALHGNDVVARPRPRPPTINIPSSGYR
ncbi:helix-turn-helix transcriptional regulator [Cellvibrio sp. KB43]|uniref:Helix-turn-helix transcriptional regulator n=1 Tax=Cellvibrio polysaccharolyticus TaxID=2082724 RepID=A0A928V7N2_9GAMM|nr:helix-turn-helix transcriptional regulator [Cellvibrio polysaccharolyticus]